MKQGRIQPCRIIEACTRPARWWHSLERLPRIVSDDRLGGTITIVDKDRGYERGAVSNCVGPSYSKDVLVLGLQPRIVDRRVHITIP